MRYTLSLLLIVGLTILAQSHATSKEVKNLIRGGGDFEDQQELLLNWTYEVHGGFVAIAKIDKKDSLTGKSCVLLDIQQLNKDTQEWWRLQFKQINQVVENGKKYTLSFWAKVEEPRPIHTWIGMEVDPWAGLGGEKEWNVVDLDWNEYFITFTANQDFNNTRLTVIGGYAKANVWLDHVRFYEGDYVPEEGLSRDLAVKPKNRLAVTWGALKN